MIQPLNRIYIPYLQQPQKPNLRKKSMLKVVSHIIISQMVRKLAFFHRHFAAILNLVKMATRVEHSLGSTQGL